MPNHLEIEFKNRLTKADYERLILAFDVKERDFFTQTNTYFDTPNEQLKQHTAALRLRKKKDFYELTLKETVEAGVLETNQALSGTVYQAVLVSRILPEGPVKARVSSLIGEKALVPIVTIETKRATLPYQGQVLFFDHSTYAGTTDYELELETEDYERGKQVFDALLDAFKIPVYPMLPKIERARQQLMKNTK